MAKTAPEVKVTKVEPEAKTAKVAPRGEEKVTKVEAEEKVTKRSKKGSITVTPTETFMGRTVRIATEGVEGPLRLTGATQKSDVHLDDRGRGKITFMHPGEFELKSKDGASAKITVSDGS